MKMIAGKQDRHTHITDKAFHHGDQIPGVSNLEGGKTSFGLEIVEVCSQGKGKKCLHSGLWGPSIPCEGP